MLTKNDIAKVGTIVTDALKTAGLVPVTGQTTTPTTTDSPVVEEIADPLVIACEKKQEEIIANLPMDQVMVRGRRGTQLVDRAAESLNTIEETLKAKTHRYTRSNVR